MSSRQGRINEEAKKEISMIVRELKDPRISKGLLSVVAVDVTKDLKRCKVYISVLGDESVQNEAMKGLKSASGFVRRELAARLDLRNTPEMIFELDHSIENGAHINDLLKEINK